MRGRVKIQVKFFNTKYQRLESLLSGAMNAVKNIIIYPVTRVIYTITVG